MRAALDAMRFFWRIGVFTVDAIDISEVALSHASAQAEGLPVRWLCQDLLASPEIPQFGYDLIIMFHFVAPTLLARLTGSFISWRLADG